MPATKKYVVPATKKYAVQATKKYEVQAIKKYEVQTTKKYEVQAKLLLRSTRKKARAKIERHFAENYRQYNPRSVNY